jgi:hypothetical protein
MKCKNVVIFCWIQVIQTQKPFYHWNAQLACSSVDFALESCLALGLIASYILIFIFNFSIIDMPGYVFSQQNTVNDRNNWHMTM